MESAGNIFSGTPRSHKLGSLAGNITANSSSSFSGKDSNLAGNTQSQRVLCELEVVGVLGTLHWHSSDRPWRYTCTNATIHPESESASGQNTALETNIALDEVKVWRQFPAKGDDLGGKAVHGVNLKKIHEFVLSACDESSLDDMRTYASGYVSMCVCICILI